MSRERGAWRRFMEPLATAAADELLRLSGSWDYSCPVCEQANTRGLADHVPSEKHWKALGGKLNWRPPPLVEDAHAWDKPWVQRIQTGRGVFMFNHLTGLHALEGQPAGHSLPSPAPGSASGPLSAPCPAAGPPSAPCPATGPLPSPCPAASPAEGQFNHAHWLWVSTARRAAGQVDEVISHRGFEGEAPKCAVCGTLPISKSHLLSLGHFNELQKRCVSVCGDVAKEAMEGRNEMLEGQSQPWVQKLELYGTIYHFNHITSKELWPEQ